MTPRDGTGVLEVRTHETHEVPLSIGYPKEVEVLPRVLRSPEIPRKKGKGIHNS